jgi:hypothetical protein
METSKTVTVFKDNSQINAFIKMLGSVKDRKISNIVFYYWLTEVCHDPSKLTEIVQLCEEYHNKLNQQQLEQIRSLLT